jgi:hypothetical protein
LSTQTPPAEKLAFTLMWDSDLREQVSTLAAVDDRSVSAVIRTALREHLARRLPEASQAPARPLRSDVFTGRDNGGVTTTFKSTDEAA